MALTTISQIPTTTPYNLRRPSTHHFLLNPSSSSSWAHQTRRPLHIVSAAGKKLKIGKFDSRNRRGSTSTKEEEKLEGFENGGQPDAEETFEGYFLPELPGDEPDFWEGPQWDGLGFFVQYMWAFGILFAPEQGYAYAPQWLRIFDDVVQRDFWNVVYGFGGLAPGNGVIISSGIAVATYNEGATDFKETPAYKESIESRDLLEEPEASNADVFESNPTEEAPSLE